MITTERINELRRNGEGLGIEFKRCSGKVEHDVFETICAFLNRFGGDILLGVENDGTVVGVKGDAAALRNNIVNVANDEHAFEPVAWLDPEIVEYDGRTLIHIHVAPSGDVHAYKGVVYDRNGDADIRVRAVAAKAMMILRKQSIFTEQRIYPHVTKADLNIADLKRLRIRAQNNVRDGRRHPWMDMDDDQLLKSVKFVGTDRVTGKVGFNLAAVMMLGSQDVIKDICPAYVTDALLRVNNVDRYDDRDYVDVNLIAAYDRLMDFARKHLPDPFYLERDVRISLREIIVREMVSNVLIHREFTSSLPAKFVIERERMFMENASRAANGELLTPENLNPNPKNPIVASFFREIAYADQLGSGVRNLFKYSRPYGGANPKMQEGDVFRTEVSLKQLKDLAIGIGYADPSKKPSVNLPVNPYENPHENPAKNPYETSPINLPKSALRTYEILKKDRSATCVGIAEKLGLNKDTIRIAIQRLVEVGCVRRVGSRRAGYWEILKDLPCKPINKGRPV